MMFNYVKYGVEGCLMSVGLETALGIDKGVRGTPFLNKGSMTMIGVVARHRVFEDLLVFADALRNSGHEVTGYETLVKDVEDARERLREYERNNDG